MPLQMFQKSLILGVGLFLTGCAVDKCNDYNVAYDCVYEYGVDCREHYLQMFDGCEVK